MVSGLVASIVAFAVGAVLDFAVTTNTEQHGFNIHTVGVILMVVGAVGAVLSLAGLLSSSYRRRRTVIDDGRGNVVTRQETIG
jgi:predicted lysophospholipase L1 biosynthesis ABC-type transport system permease subunit